MRSRCTFRRKSDRRIAKLVKMGGSGSLGITLPKDKLDERGLEAGDEVGIVTTANPDVLKIHFPPKPRE